MPDLDGRVASRLNWKELAGRRARCRHPAADISNDHSRRVIAKGIAAQFGTDVHDLVPCTLRHSASERCNQNGIPSSFTAELATRSSLFCGARVPSGFCCPEAWRIVIALPFMRAANARFCSSFM